MPYAHISSMVSHRVRETRELLNTCGMSGVTPDACRALRGHMYVSLYGMYEQAVAKCVDTAIKLVNKDAIAVSRLKDGLLLFALRDDLESYRDISQEKTWERGIRLLQKLASSDPAKLAGVFPADGSFMRPPQLRVIWQLFDLSGDPWPTPQLIGRIYELVEARNHIAHGSEAPGERGGRISDGDASDRIDDIEALCVHIVTSFATQLSTTAHCVK